ncbi:hypothetical protein TrRE_jg4778 [Triparma retinervis]|uniref:Uncharacterized protein n=1 Tax=Triparma retinervis TaxID=2557542 RepID=A0A9W7L4U9_9STRA|nr:hypothetical protein TrRE_jg4778 [Triparma retinervis]
MPKVTLPPAPEDPSTATGPVLDWATSTAALFVKPDEAPEGVPAPDLMKDATLYKWAGVSFGDTETYMLNLSLKKFCESLDGGYEAVKFWGKIITRDGDYFVCYGKTPEDPEEMDATKMEGKDGANKYTYFVTKSPSSPWVALPNVTMAQIVTAGKIRRLLTGDLEAAVPSFPPFPGVEKNLLRAMIAQITADTAIAPSGTFEADEDGANIIPAANEDGAPEPKTCEELLEAGNWQHYELRINTLGRCTALPEPEDAEDYEPPEGDGPAGLLESCGEEGEGYTTGWSFRPCPGGQGMTSTSCAKGVSLDWPGAYAVGGGSDFVNIYVGNGLKYSEATYTPPLPGAIAGEWSVPEEDADAEVEPGTFPIEAKDVTADPTPPAEEGEEDE